MTVDSRYQKGMSLGWRLCLIVSLFASIPRLIFVWSPYYSGSILGTGIRDMLIQFVFSFLFAWVFLHICLNYTYQRINWFNRQKNWVKLISLTGIFVSLNEILVGLKILLDQDDSDVILFRLVYYLYHFLVVLTIIAFRYFLLTTQANYKIGLENEQLKREQLKAQLEALRNQLNPHFLFNALNILNISIVTNPDLAQRIVLDLSDILRYNLKVQNQNLVLLQDELDAARSYLDLYKARFGEKLVFYFANIEMTKQWYIIPLSLQILIENAIKHNVITSHQVLSIEVKLSETDKKLTVINSVNKKQQVPGTGIGLKNLDKRYKIQTGEKPLLLEDEQLFTVQVPLIEVP
ncbi:hypothetical protein DYBT9275_02016 [Dyadobacter sp. CECT 9275]|uniref:Signal transduction histidine kinase internal region domain-containing protein n=1 Tax=Dyadobacter helix TaxID=2822344 RepID=A0A916JCC1_9BACT|nr:histidine kinase [Dyadobacter sp. CECT 9275]CAG4998518.1 hypothetical protein DYBT9275_02016 [Dyadobacter sp. CECT 9275]